MRKYSSKLFLTFDDGPHPHATPITLAILEKYNIKATFFCTGSNIKAYPEIYQSILSMGHSVGNHTYNHLNGWVENSTEYIQDILLGQELVKSQLFRPPFGKINLFSYPWIKKHFSIIMWSLMSYDFDSTLNVDVMIQKMTSSVRKGDILVFHNNDSVAKRIQYYLPEIVERLLNQGFEFGKLNDNT